VSVVLGIDIGGSGTRAVLAERMRTDAAALTLGDGMTGDPIGVTAAGSTVPAAALALVRRAAEAWPDRMRHLTGVGVGATGLATLVERPADLVDAIAAEVDALTHRRVGVAVAIDAVTAHLGALDGEAGAIVALGTGAIAFGTDGADVWRRVDGWGHLVGDRGGGAWIGMQGLTAALRAHDGVDPAGTVLLDAAQRRFGDPLTWPAQLYTRDDRAGVLASFAADVAHAASAGDAGATAIMVQAGREAARSAVAALDPRLPPVVAATGGVFRPGGALALEFERAVTELRPSAEVRAPVGDPLRGAAILAERVAAGRIATHAPYVWVGRQGG
jgi:N-acetylglucosamine kinase-like BadF-type ATPase